MKIYRAETGQAINWQSNSSNIKNIEELKNNVECDIGIPAEDQILMTNFGKLVRKDNLTEILNATGKDEFIVFCYDRRYLGATEDDIETLLDSETPPLEPEVASFNGTVIFSQFKNSLKNLSLDEIAKAYLALFAQFESYNQVILRKVVVHCQLSKLIVDEQKMQAMALQVAMTNLESHTRLSEACIQHFVAKAQKEYDRQQALLNSVNDDIAILQKVRINPSVSRLLEPIHQSKRFLIDFVDQDQIRQARDETSQLCYYLSDHIISLKEEMKELTLEEEKFRQQVMISSDLQTLDSILADIQHLDQEIQKKRSRTERDFKRVCERISAVLMQPISTLLDHISTNSLSDSSFNISQPSPLLKPNVKPLEKKKMFESMYHLAEFHIFDYLPKMSQLQSAIRQKTSELITSKRKAIESFIINMTVVSKFEQHVGKIQPNVDEHLHYLDSFKQKYANHDLESLRNVLFAYGAIMIELLRRKEYSNLLISNSNLFANVLSRYRTEEENRRDHFRHVVSKSFPFKPINSIIDKPSTQCEIIIRGNTNDGIELKKQDIHEFISMITQVYTSSPQLRLSQKRNSRSKRVTNKFIPPDEETFLTLLRQMMKDMEDIQSHFLSLVQSQFTHLDLPKPDEPLNRRFSQLNLNQKSSVNHSSPTLSVFSVVEDDQKLSAENRELKNKLESAEEDVVLLEQKNQEQADELNHLKEIIKNLESEKDEFEVHRQSFLNELKNKDKTADFRIQTAEEDFHVKLSDLQYELEEERRMKKNLEIEHASELNTLHTEHQSEIEKLKAALKQEREKNLAILKEKEELMEDMNALKDKIETDRTEHEEQLSKLQSELRAADEITQFQEQMRNMVKRVQRDWESKNEELKETRKEYKAIETAVRELVQRFRPNDPELDRMSLDAYVRSFKQNLELFEKDYDMTKENVSALEQELEDVTHSFKHILEEHHEWRAVASRMAEKLEEYRKNVVLELVNQLQLSVSEKEMDALKKNITPSDDNTTIWNEVLYLSSTIDTQQLVLQIHKRTKESYEQAKQFKREYKNIKEKYNKLCTVYCDKIAFRNFKVGDVALFLPTKNSTGKPWAAFNINAPHYFLKLTENSSIQTQNKEYVVARIINITEHTTDESNPGHNPYGLLGNVKYHLLEVEPWRTSKHHSSSKKRRTLTDTGLASISLPGETGSSSSSFQNSLSGNFVHTYTAQQSNSTNK